VTPNPDQERLAALPIGNVLVIAPAGCGKTEALATRAKALVARGDVVAPRKILALTFSNKAKQNLATRVHSIFGAGASQRITVTNFHGIAARVVRAHGAVVGIPSDVTFPEDPWRKRQRRDLGITYKNGDEFEAALADAKRGTFGDDEVLNRLIATGNDRAIAYEERLRAEGRLDYDDLIRHGARLLAIPAVSKLYQAHFAMTMVDEVQDLSILQYEMVRSIGGDTVTYAGDPAQGIYSFAGAEPVEVFNRIDALEPEVVEFNLSYRSGPAVLGAVNALAAHMGMTQLQCASPECWEDPGRVISVERGNMEDEAAALLSYVTRFTTDPESKIGVVHRGGKRVTTITGTAADWGLSFEDWGLPTHVPAVVDLISRETRQCLAAGGTDQEILALLEDRCRALIEPGDADLLDELAGAFDLLRSLVEEGQDVKTAIASCRPSATPGSPVGPGLHVLTAHKGKGQEFDWVFVVGLEEGVIPDFRTKNQEQFDEELRVLHVMVSRARYGLVFSSIRTITTQYGTTKTKEPSPWLELLRSAATEFDHD
jgi:DNA helicase-2/ATP-dependent DNA helicase PcrA